MLKFELNRTGCGRPFDCFPQPRDLIDRASLRYHALAVTRTTLLTRPGLALGAKGWVIAVIERPIARRHCCC